VRLMLLRHAKSEHPADVSDHERPLSDRGRRDSLAMGRYIQDAGLAPRRAVVSTARRAQETWDLVREMLDIDVDWCSSDRIYDASAETLLEIVRDSDAGVRKLLLVGHNPGLHELALDLIGAAEPLQLARLQRKLPTAGLVAIKFKPHDSWDVPAGSGKLERFATPSSLRRR
jgi:phosphohistidine phosphatase